MADSLEEAILKIAKAHFVGATVDSVTVVPDVDHDGDRVLWITVVFDSDIAKLAHGQLAGLASVVRPEIRQFRDDCFPIFRFMSKRDNDRLKNVAA